jgi:hypothetical protein
LCSKVAGKIELHWNTRGDLTTHPRVPSGFFMSMEAPTEGLEPPNIFTSDRAHVQDAIANFAWVYTPLRPPPRGPDYGNGGAFPVDTARSRFLHRTGTSKFLNSQCAILIHDPPDFVSSRLLTKMARGHLLRCECLHDTQPRSPRHHLKIHFTATQGHAQSATWVDARLCVC